MSVRTDYTEEEWYSLWKAVVSTATATMVADPENLVQEAFAADHALQQEGKKTTEPLLRLLLHPTKSEDAHLSLWLDNEQRNRRSATPDEFQIQTLTLLATAIEILTAHGSAAEVAAYKEVVWNIACTVANASKEGDFFGFGGVKLNENEKIFLRDLAQLLERAIDF